jgi:hypothetical protein
VYNWSDSINALLESISAQEGQIGQMQRALNPDTKRIKGYEDKLKFDLCSLETLFKDRPRMELLMADHEKLRLDGYWAAEACMNNLAKIAESLFKTVPQRLILAILQIYTWNPFTVSDEVKSLMQEATVITYILREFLPKSITSDPFLNATLNLMAPQEEYPTPELQIKCLSSFAERLFWLLPERMVKAVFAYRIRTARRRREQWLILDLDESEGRRDIEDEEQEDLKLIAANFTAKCCSARRRLF